MFFAIFGGGGTVRLKKMSFAAFFKKDGSELRKGGFGLSRMDEGGRGTMYI